MSDPKRKFELDSLGTADLKLEQHPKPKATPKRGPRLESEQQSRELIERIIDRVKKI